MPQAARPERTCRTCGKVLYRYSKGDYCRQHRTDDVEAERRRVERIRETFYARPDIADGRRKFLQQLNRSPEARARSGRLAAERELWNFGLPKINAETRRKGGRTTSERRLAHVPIEHRPLYFRLQDKGFTAAEAYQQVLEHIRASAARLASRIEAQRKHQPWIAPEDLES